MKRIAIPDLGKWKKEGRKIVMVTAYDYSSARLLSQTDIEMALVGDSLGMTMLGYDSTVPVTMEEMIHHVKPVARGAGDCFIVADMPFGSYNSSIGEAIKNGTRFLKEAGADAVKLEGGEEVADTVRAMVRAGIPVMGHLGLTPQTIAQLGGYRIQGRDVAGGRKLLRDAQALQAAGAFSLVLECVPVPLAQLVTERLTITTIGIGAGPDCDGQVLVYHDLLGLYDRMLPKFVKQYAQLGKVAAAALTSYAAEVRGGQFPGPEHGFAMTEETLAEIREGTEQLTLSELQAVKIVSPWPNR